MNKQNFLDYTSDCFLKELDVLIVLSKKEGLGTLTHLLQMVRLEYNILQMKSSPQTELNLSNITSQLSSGNVGLDEIRSYLSPNLNFNKSQLS